MPDLSIIEHHPQRVLEAFRRGEFDQIEIIGQADEKEFFELCFQEKMLEALAHNVERSKAKDDERGPRIIDDYATVHVLAHEDPFVRQTWEETRVLKHEVQELLNRLGA